MDEWKLILRVLVINIILPSTLEQTCPAPFIDFEDKCYILNATACPYHLPLSFDNQTTIAMTDNITNVKLNATKIPNCGYFQWAEIRGNYGKVFTNEITNDSDIFGAHIVANFDATTDVAAYYTITDENASYVCAYDSLEYRPITSYCQRYDKICANGTSALNSTNCHCANVTRAHFCELSCDDSAEFDETVCGECAQIFDDYERPILGLNVNRRKNIVFVIAMSYLKLLPTDGTEVPVYCYTDADHSPHDVTYRYNSSEFHIYATDYKNTYYRIAPRDGAIGHYWCEAIEMHYGEVFQRSSGPIIMEAVGTAPSFTMNVTVDFRVSYPPDVHEVTRDAIQTDLNRLGYIASVQFLHLYETTVANATVLSYRLYYDPSVKDDVSAIFVDVIDATTNYSDVALSPSYCLPEVTYTADNATLSWPSTPVGMTTVPEELCLRNDSTPVTRTCHGEYLYGTYWSEVSGTCANDSGEIFGSDHTVALHTLRHSPSVSADKIERLRRVLSDRTAFIAVDVHFVAVIFENVTRSDDFFVLSTLIEVASDVMALDRVVLRDAQLLLNSTDMILYSVDLILGTYGQSDYFTIITRNIYVQVSRISAANITGAAFYDDGAANARIVPFYTNATLDDFELADLKLAVFVSEAQLQQVHATTRNDSRLVIVVFRRASLFNHIALDTITGYQVGVHITHFEEPYMSDYVRVLTRPDRKYRARLKCDRWHYGRDQIWYNQRGYWEYVAEATPYADDFYLCQHWSLRHFGIVVGVEDDVALSIVSAVGCALSMCGSLAVVITGIVYKNWREKSGTKILLNFVLTNLAQNAILGASSAIDSYTQVLLCEIVGACLHYSVVSQFTWMMIIGYLQYLRYVRVFYTVETRFVVVSSMVAWILPIIPVTAILSIKMSYYVQDEFCYLQDAPLFLGVFLPVSFTLAANLIIFGLILFNVYYRNNDLGSSRDNMSWLNIRLVVILFFLLGLYWFFGIAARFTRSTALDYFFCISAGLQGFVIFLYFIVFNKMTRNFWLRRLKRSEMITAMQLWLQRKNNVGKVLVDKSQTRTTKVGIVKSLEKSK